MTTSTVEDAEAERRVHGEATEPVPAGAGARPSLDDRPFDDDFELPEFVAAAGRARAARRRPATARAGRVRRAGRPASTTGPTPSGERPTTSAGDELAAEPATRPADEPDPVAGEAGGGSPPTGRGRRGRGRTPVPA